MWEMLFAKSKISKLSRGACPKIHPYDKPFIYSVHAYFTYSVIYFNSDQNIYNIIIKYTVNMSI